MSDVSSTKKYCAECGEKFLVSLARCPTCGSEKDAAGRPPMANKIEENKADTYKADGYTGVNHNSTANTVSLPQKADTSAPELKEALSKVTSQKDPTNWLAFNFEDGGRSEKLQVFASGEGGLDELKNTLDKAKPEVLFGIFLVIGSTEDGGCVARRDKICYYSFVGSGVPEMLKAQAAPLKRQVSSFFGSTSGEYHLDGNHLDLISANAVGFNLQNSSGSHKCTFFDFGGKTGKVPTSKFVAAEEDEEEEEDFD